MLKKFLLALVALCLVMVALVARAEVDPRVFAKAGGDGWPALEAQLKKDGMLTGEVIQTNALEAIAYGVAKNRKIVPQGVNDGEVFPQFVGAFRQLNGLGDTITVAEFRALATGNGIYLPEYTGEVSTAEKTGSVVEQPSTIQFVGVPDSTERLERQIAELRKQLAQVRIDVRNGDGQVATLAGERLQKLDQQLAGIKGQLEKLPSTAKVDELSKEVADASALLKEMPGLKQTLAEQATSISKLWLIAGGAGALATLAFLVALIGNLRVAKTRVIAESAETKWSEASTAIAGLEDSVTELKDSVGSMESDFYKIYFHKDVVQADRLELMRIGEICELGIQSVGDEKTIATLKIVRTQTGVDVYGIKRAKGHRENFTSYPITDLATVIRRAYNRGCLSGVQSVALVNTAA